MILDTKFLDGLTAKAKESPRLRMNYNLHVNTSESYILIRGALRVTLLDDEKNVIETAELNLNNGVFGFQIPANTWHKVEVLESSTVIFEVKDGPYTPLTIENLLEE